MIGGAKVADKIGVLWSLLEKVRGEGGSVVGAWLAGMCHSHAHAPCVPAHRVLLQLSWMWVVDVMGCALRRRM